MRDAVFFECDAARHVATKSVGSHWRAVCDYPPVLPLACASLSYHIIPW